MARLTRKERQAHTRECLMHSAAKLFAERGLQQASIDDLAEDAGFTKGAFYANFKNKEELFLAMLDEKFAERAEQIQRVVGGEGTGPEKALQAGDDFSAMLRADPEWQRLFFEFAAHALRQEGFRAELVTRYRELRARLADLFRERAEELGVEPPIAAERVALMTFALLNGLALEGLLEPDEITEDLYGEALMLFFAGLRTLTAEQVPAAR